MGIKATRPGAKTTKPATAQTTEVNNTMEQNSQTSVPAGNVDQHAPANNVPAQRQASAPAVKNGGNAMADMNAGILDNIDDLNVGGNYVTIDGSEFLYKDTNEVSKEIDLVVSFGKRFYQWYDEDNEQYHNSDTKLDDRYRMKFEIRWLESQGEDEEPKEYIMSLPTASAMSFLTYVKALANKGYGVGQVITRMTISRQQRKGTNDRYSRAEFEMIGTA